MPGTRRHVSQLTLAEVFWPLVAIAGPIGGLLLVINRDLVLPVQFLYDSQKIQQAAQGFFFNDPSFDLVGLIYRDLGLGGQPVLAGCLGFVAYVWVLYLGTFRMGVRASPQLISIFSVASLVGAVYLGGYSKDIFVLPIVAIALIRSRKVVVEAVLVGSMLLYAAELRRYWYLVACTYLLLRIVMSRPRLRRASVLFIATCGAIAGVSLGVFLFMHQAPDAYRVSVNDLRDPQVATATVIKPYIEGLQPLTGIVNNLLTAATLTIPIPIALLGGPYYVVIAAIIGSTWLSFAWSSLSKLRRREFDFDDQSRLDMSRSIVLARCIALTLGFLAVQSLFEPDYGSALRHLTPILPAMIALTGAGRDQTAEGVLGGEGVVANSYAPRRVTAR